MEAVKWEIIIMSLNGRGQFLNQLLGQLSKQIEGIAEVIITVRYDGGPANAIGDRREIVRRESTAEYINFVDDDDLVSPNYVSRILPLLDGVDYVGFDLATFIDKESLGVTSHSLEYSGWKELLTNKPPTYLRDISHLNPMRRELALQVPMSGGFGEDRRWADGMRGRVKTEHFVREQLYYYLSRTKKNDAADAHDPWRMRLLADLTPKTNQSL